MVSSELGLSYERVKYPPKKHNRYGFQCGEAAPERIVGALFGATVVPHHLPIRHRNKDLDVSGGMNKKTIDPTSPSFAAGPR